MSFLQRRQHSPGTAPGTYDTELTRERIAPSVRVLDFDRDRVVEQSGLDAVVRPLPGACRWIRVSGPPSLEVLQTLKEQLSLDPMLLEDVVNSGQRPKFADLQTHYFATLMLPDAGGTRDFAQLSIVLAGPVVVSFDDGRGDPLAAIEKRLQGSARVSALGAPYLFYTLLDLAVDLLFPYLERVGLDLDGLEEDMLERPSAELLSSVHRLRRDLLVVRKIAWATREVISDIALRFADGDLANLNVYLMDARDHIYTVIDLVELHRDLAASLIELHMSLLSNRMNEVIRLLTLIATLFIPPTFIVGVYGMNFDRAAGSLNMPELGWPLGYVAVLGLCGLTMLGMLIYFKRKHWL